MMRNRLLLIIKDMVPNALASIELRPPDGYNWEIIDAWGFHDDTVNCSVYWAYTHEGSVSTRKFGPSVGAAARVPISTHEIADGNTLTGRLIASHETYPRFGTDSITAGKILKIRALVREFDAEVL